MEDSHGTGEHNSITHPAQTLGGSWEFKESKKESVVSIDWAFSVIITILPLPTSYIIVSRKSFTGVRTLLSILIDLNRVVVWMVSVRHPISSSSSSFNKPFGTFPSLPINIGITVTLMFQSFIPCESFSDQR